MAELYTSSRLRVWRQCNRAHLFRYVLGIQTPQNAAMAFGTYAHKALEHWYRAWQLGKPELRAVDALEYVDSIPVEEIDEIDRIRLRTIVAAYDARWGGEDWDVLAVEAEFRYWLGDIEIGGKIDALVCDRATGRAYVVEHKTSTADTSPGSPYWDKLSLDTQISIYTDGATYGLDVEIAGCIYDVLKRPMHELKLATPAESRKLTAGKGCKKCGGSAKAGEVIQGNGYYTVAFTTVEQIKCDGCDGTGWKLDKDGKPEMPRLHANQRDADETLEEYEERLAAEVAERVDDYLSRGVIVRLDSELPKMRQELIDTIEAMRALDAKNLAPANHDACVRGREMCAFFPICSGRSDVSDEHAWPRGAVHQELSNAVA